MLPSKLSRRSSSAKHHLRLNPDHDHRPNNVYSHAVQVFSKLLALRVGRMLDFRVPFLDATTTSSRRHSHSQSQSPSSSPSSFPNHHHTQPPVSLQSLAFQGDNPFDICITYKTTAALSDTDYNGILSTTAYGKALDYARMRAAIICFPSVLDARGWLGLGDSQFCFIKVRCFIFISER